MFFSRNYFTFPLAAKLSYLEIVAGMGDSTPGQRTLALTVDPIRVEDQLLQRVQLA